MVELQFTNIAYCSSHQVTIPKNIQKNAMAQDIGDLLLRFGTSSRGLPGCSWDSGLVCSNDGLYCRLKPGLLSSSKRGFVDSSTRDGSRAFNTF